VQRILIKKCFLFAVVRVYRVKLFTAGSKILSRTFECSNARAGEKVAEAGIERLRRCGFRRSTKALSEVYQCWWRIFRKYFSQVRISHTLRLILICGSLVRVSLTT
jgi:hypothetical protein